MGSRRFRAKTLGVPYGLALLSALAAATPAPAASLKAYVTLCCSTPATVTVLNAATGAAIGAFPAGVGAALMAPTPDNRSIYVLTQLYHGVPGEPWAPTPGAVNSIVVLDMPDGRPSTVIPLTAMPMALAFSHSGQLAYVLAVDSNYLSHLLVVDTQSQQVVRDQPFGQYLFGPQMQILVSSDDSLLYLATYAGTAIWKVDAQSFSILNSFPCQPYCQGLALAEQDTVLLTVVGTSTVYYLDAASFQVTRQLPWPLPSGVYAGWVIPVSPDGSTAFVGSNPSMAPVGSLAGLDIASGTFTPVLTGMGIFQAAAISSDDAYLATDTLPTTLSILDLPPAIVPQIRNVTTLAEIASVFFSDGRIYVLNAGSSHVAEIDVGNGQVTGAIPAGAAPVSLAAQPVSHRLYIANELSRGISVIDTAASKVLRNFAIPWTGQYTQAVAVASDNLFVADLEALQMLSLKTGTFQRLAFPNVGCFPVFRGLAASPDRQQVYMAFRTALQCPPPGDALQTSIPAGVNIYDGSTGALLKQIPVPGAAQVTFSVAGNYAFVGASTPTQTGLEVIDTQNQSIKGAIAIPAARQINGLSASPDGQSVYVLDSSAATVYVVDLSSGQTTAGILVGGQPSSLAATPDGRFVYVTDRVGPSLSVIDAATNQVSGTISLGTGSSAVAFLPE
jgi:YVTN family beta-propeller protein